MRHATTTIAISLFAGLLASGCGKDEGSDQSAPAAEAKAPATDDKAAPPATQRPAKDRGEASMKLGDTAWTADRVRAKKMNGALRIHASHTEVDNKKVTRQELNLLVPDFHGPGDYVASPGGSRFIGVGMDVKAAAGAADDADQKKLAMDAVSKAKHMLLSGANVHIDAASDTEVSGTFSWQPSGGNDQPITDGRFRAPIDDRKR